MIEALDALFDRDVRELERGLRVAERAPHERDQDA